MLWIMGDFDLLGAAKVNSQVLARIRGQGIVSAGAPGAHRSVIPVQPVKQPASRRCGESRGEFRSACMSGSPDDPAIFPSSGMIRTAKKRRDTDVVLLGREPAFGDEAVMLVTILQYTLAQVFRL